MAFHLQSLGTIKLQIDRRTNNERGGLNHGAAVWLLYGDYYQWRSDRLYGVNLRQCRRIASSENSVQSWVQIVPRSSNHPIRPRQHAWWNCQTDLLGCLHIGDQFKFHRLLYGQIRGFRTF